MSVKFADLFAGIGGTRLGFERSGGQCVFTAEKDPFCQKTYAANFSVTHTLASDIRLVDPAAIPDHSVLLAGFPCQPFSIAGVSKKISLGQPHGFECRTQGTLFFNVAQILRDKKPTAFLLENVRNLVSHDKKNTFRIILETLQNDLGYHVQWRILDARHFLPQHRQRLIIVGFRHHNSFSLDNLPLPEPTTRLRDILHPENGSEKDTDDGRYTELGGRVRDKYILSPKLWDYLQQYAAKHRAQGNGFGFGLVGPDDYARTLSARYYKDGSEILINRGTGQLPRRLTPRECARLMGFPDTFRIPVSDTQAYRQFGNSVAVPLIHAVATHMRPWIGEAR